MIDPRTSVEGIREYILESEVRTVIVLDVAYSKVLKSLEGTNVENVIVVSPADSLPAVKKKLYNLSKGRVKLDPKHFKWNAFISNGANQEMIETPYRENECAVIVHTGGTSGTPKGVMLSNDNLNQSAFQLMNSAFTMARGDKWADIMPPFIAYGIGNGLHMPLIKGMSDFRRIAFLQND